MTVTAEPIHIPNITSYEALTIDIQDLLIEAGNWCDGEAATTQEQVDEIARLKDELTDRAKLLEAAKLAFYSEVDLTLAGDVEANGWLWPDNAPSTVTVTAERLRAAIARATRPGEV